MVRCHLEPLFFPQVTWLKSVPVISESVWIKMSAKCFNCHFVSFPQWYSDLHILGLRTQTDLFNQDGEALVFKGFRELDVLGSFVVYSQRGHNHVSQAPQELSHHPIPLFLVAVVHLRSKQKSENQLLLCQRPHHWMFADIWGLSENGDVLQVQGVNRMLVPVLHGFWRKRKLNYAPTLNMVLELFPFNATSM